MYNDIYRELFSEKKSEDLLFPFFRDFISSSSEINRDEWQSIKVEQPMVEVNNFLIQIDIPVSLKDLQNGFKPHLPWAEDHFKERITDERKNPHLMNPGVQWENWPFYRKEIDDNRFRSNENKFDHTYQERFWPTEKKGERYLTGTYQDIKDRLKGNKHTRQAYLSIWHPEDQSNDKKGKRLPCSLGYHFIFFDGKLNLNYFMRSCDIVRHFRNDLYIAARLLQTMSKDLKLKPGRLTVFISNLHCFKSDLYALKKMLK